MKNIHLKPWIEKNKKEYSDIKWYYIKDYKPVLSGWYHVIYSTKKDDVDNKNMIDGIIERVYYDCENNKWHINESYHIIVFSEINPKREYMY